MDRAAPDIPVDSLRHHPHLAALLTYHGQVFHLAIVAFFIGGMGEVNRANTIAGAAIIIWVPAACLTAVLWSRLRLERDRQPTDAAHQPRREPLDVAG
jgi:hypothetical protein